MQKLFFISGTGRSGTHLIGRSIASHPQINGRIEKKDTFKLITKIATSQDFRSSFYISLLKNILVFRLKSILKKTNKHVLEKSHPSLWLIEFLISEFDNAYFIGVYREVEPTVSSMLNHKGVLKWYKKLPLDKKNGFLGITDANKKEFKSYSLIKKCTLRWFSHKKELYSLKEKYPTRILIIKYEDFLKSPNQFITEFTSLTDVKDDFVFESFKFESLEKWQKNLSKKQIEEIHQVLKNRADERYTF